MGEGLPTGRGRELVKGERLEGLENPTPPIGQEYLAEMKPRNKQGQETLVIAYTFLMCQGKKKKKSYHWR